MSAFNAMGSAVYSKLSGGTALTALLAGTTSIYNTDAPFNAAYDYVIFNVQGAGESNDTAHRVKDVTLQVRGYSTSLSKAGSIDAQRDALLHGGSLSITGWRTLWQVRSQDIELVEY